MSPTTASGMSFSVQFEGTPDKKPVYQAVLFAPGGRILFQSPVEADAFTVPGDARQLRGARLFLLPLPPGGKPEQITVAQAANQPGSREVILPLNPQPDTPVLITVAQQVWNFWFFCRCHVRGRVFNQCGAGYSPVMGARVHIMEVDPVWWWLTRLPDRDILSIRGQILEKVAQKTPVIPIPDPGPEISGAAALPVAQASFRAGTTDLRSLSVTDQASPAVYAADLLPKENLMAFYSDSAAAVRGYLLENYKLLTPVWCWIESLFLRAQEIAVVDTNETGWFESDISYWCFGDHPDLYFWVEYNINGVWTTVYRPPVACHTYWNYACGSEIDIYLADDRIPCPASPTVPGRVVIVTTLGNNVNVSRVGQSGAHKGLSDSIFHPNALPGPFGGTLEPHVIFGEDLLTGANPVKYYRWSYAKEGTGEWSFTQHPVTRHYLHIEYVGGVPFPSFPVYSLGPDINGLMEIQTPRSPVTDDPWAILDARADTASAFFETVKLHLGSDTANPEFYELKLELFHADASPVDFTAEAISLFMPEASQQAPFGQDPVTTVPIDASHNTAYQYLNEATGVFQGFKMVVRIDNNGTSAHIQETWVDMPSNKAGECGMIRYSDKNTSKAHLSFNAAHPFDFAWFGFGVYKGSAGTVHAVSGNVNDVPPVTAEDLNPVPPPSYLPSTDAYSFNHGDWRFDTDKPVGKLLGSCDEAAFAETLNVYGTTTDGWSRLGYDSSDVKAFALKQ